jgi:DNA-binding beta-propeller fold protein YncE
MRRPILALPSRARTAALAALALAAGCAAPQKPATERVVWPPPPDVARIEYVRTLASGADIATGADRFWSAITGRQPAGLLNPGPVALSPDGKRLYVSCSSAGTVQYFDFERGKLARTADQEGFKPKRPFGLAVDGDGNLYVGDQVDSVVWVYSPEGKFLRRIGQGMFDRTAGLAFDRRRQQLYVVDGGTGTSRRHRVEVFAPDGRHVRTIGTRGEKPGEFNFPTYAAVSPDGRLFVADALNFRVQVFDPEGNFITMFGSIGEAAGAFDKMKGIAFDTFGNVYVVDGKAGFVQIYSPSLQLLMFFGGVLPREEFFQIPNGIAIDDQNNIYVSDFVRSTVNQYKLINTTATDSQPPAEPPRPDAGTAPGGAAPAPPAN